MTAGDVSVLNTNNSHRPALVCDGTDDYGQVDAATVALVASNSTTGAIMGWVKPLNPLGTYTMFSSGDANVIELLELGIHDGSIHAKCSVGGAVQWHLDSVCNECLKDNKWHHIAVVQNGTRPTLYFDGVAVDMTDTDDTDLTAWYDELTGGDKGAIGILNMNATLTKDFDGGISGVKIYNAITLTAAEIYNEFAHEDAGFGLGDGRKAALALALHNHWVCDDLTDDGTGADNMTLVNQAVNHSAYSDMTQKVNDAYTHANDVYSMVAHGGDSYTVMIVHGA